MMKAIAIIPARGGSKGIPGKNIRVLGGKPLLAWSIEHARNTSQISRVFVSTDSPEIAAVARSYGAGIINRPSDISGDTASSESCLIHALDTLQSAKGEAPSGKPDGAPPTAHRPQSASTLLAPCSELSPVSGFRTQPSALQPPSSVLCPPTSETDLRPLTSDLCQPGLCQPDLVVFLQATSPMREPDDIQRAIETLERENADSLFSACRVEGFVWRVEKDGTTRSFTYDHKNRPRRQDAPEDLIENGSIYIFKPWVLRQFNNRLGGKIAVYRMPALNSFQIDEPADLELIEALMAYRQRGKGEGASVTVYQSSVISHQSSSLKPPTSETDLRPLASDLCKIKLLVLDFDGVLTDNRVLVSEDGKEAVTCDRGDGLGVSMLKAAGVEVVVISKERNPVVAARCQKLGIECIQACDEKFAALRQRAERQGLSAKDIAFVGNDINDLECLRWVGLPIAVADAVPEAKMVAKWTTTRCGGQGAVREVCDHILRAKEASARDAKI